MAAQHVQPLHRSLFRLLFVFCTGCNVIFHSWQGNRRRVVLISSWFYNDHYFILQYRCCVRTISGMQCSPRLLGPSPTIYYDNNDDTESIAPPHVSFPSDVPGTNCVVNHVLLLQSQRDCFLHHVPLRYVDGIYVQLLDDHTLNHYQSFCGYFRPSLFFHSDVQPTVVSVDVRLHHR